MGYSRAVRVGNIVEVSGTTAVDGDQVIGMNDLYKQAVFIFRKIELALREAGAEIKHVVRTKMYVTDISRWEEAANAHAEIFKNIRPAATMVEIKSLIHPDLLIEIEVTAIIED